jgi:hypothetical protein
MNIPGPTGTLQADYRPAHPADGSQAVLCHPHPQYGGSRHDAVLGCLADVLLESGVGVLRFDFRGVGGSEGRYDGGPGEVADLLAAADWLNQRHGGPLWIGGYSFGAWVAWQALHHGLTAERVLLVAPPVGPMAFPPRPATELPPTDVFVGDADAFVDAAALAAWAGVTVHRLPGADHFFSDAQDTLTAAIRRALAEGATPA